MKTNTGTKDRTVQALMGLLEEMKRDALQAGRYNTLNDINPEKNRQIEKEGRSIQEFSSEAFDTRNKDAAFKCLRYTTLVNWTIPHLNKAIKRLLDHPEN